MMAEPYAYSWQKPIASITIQIDTAAIHQHIKQLMQTQKISVSLADMVLQAIAKMIPDFPEFNSQFTSKIMPYAEVNLGYFINLGQGSRLAVIHHANTKSVEMISREIKNLALKYIHGELSDVDAKQSTLAITNLAAFDIFNINSPVLEHHSIMISLASEFDSVEVVEGTIIPKRKFNFTLSFDARVADCQRALQFIHSIKKMLEEN